MTTATEVGQFCARPCAEFTLDRQRLTNSIARNVAATTLMTFLGPHAPQLESRGSGLKAQLLGLLRRLPEFDFSWAPAFIGMSATTSGACDPTAAAADAAMLASSMGVNNAWSAVLEQPRRLRWGSLVLPPAESVRVVATTTGTSTITLTTTDQDVKRFQLDPDASSSEDGCLVDSSAQRVARVRESGILLHSGDTARPECVLPEDVAGKVATPTPSDVAKVEQAWSIAGAAGPEYGSWIGQVIREVMWVRVEHGRMRSGSNAGWPGVIYLSDAPATVLAENLVHEAAHQYLYTATQLEPFEDGADPTLYFSPVTGRTRPLSAILLAFHAFTNVYQFLGDCLAAGVGDLDYCRARRAVLHPQLLELLRPLDGQPSLTAAGRALVGPLRNCLMVSI